MNGLENDELQVSGRVKRQILRNDGNDALAPPKERRRPQRRFQGPLPEKVFLKTSVVYDRSLKQYFGSSDKRTKEWISRVVELTKPRMAHSSLDLPVNIVVENVDYLDQEIKANNQNISSLEPTSFTSYFCEDIGSGIIGIAFLRAACRTDGFNHNINELYTKTDFELAIAKVYAHEIGHNIGMQ